MNKQIAIFGWKIGDNSYGITLPYYDFFAYFGDVNILSPVVEIDFEEFDLVVVPGGPDVNPATYGRVPSMSTGKSDPIREYFDKYLLPLALESSTPVVGICRGHQSIAVRYNGTLNQHMHHTTNLPAERHKEVHGINIFTDSFPKELREGLMSKLHKMKGQPDPTKLTQEVNSLHHQIIENVPPGARLVASHSDKAYKNDHSIEALYYPKSRTITFQYHPEEIWDAFSSVCISYLLSLKEKENEKGTVETIEVAITDE